MSRQPTIAATIEYVRDLFNGVTDKGGKPYADHCLRVWTRAGSIDIPDDEQHAALLHDVIEDTTVTAEELLLRGYSERTVWLVRKLSRRPEDGTYMEWIRALAATGDQGLIRIKLADNLDNSDPVRIAALSPAERGIADRYKRARRVLTEALATPKDAP